MNSKTSNFRSLRLTWLVCFLGWTANVALGQPSKILAHVGEQPITFADVDFQLGRQAADGEPLPALPPVVLQNTIHLIGLQRQALAALRKADKAVSLAEVNRWLETNPPPSDAPEVKLKADQIVQAVCNQTGQSPTSYRDLIAFRLSWLEYLKTHLTDANVKKHFENQRERFDGTQFDIEVVSIAVPAGQSAARSKAVAQLAKLKQVAPPENAAWSELTQEVGIEQPEIIERRQVRGTGDVDPLLVDILLKMQPGETSAAAQTATGVHLIRLHGKRAGSRTLVDARDEIRAHMLLFLLEHLASRSRSEMPLKSDQP
ncbi:MAG: peptidyl-prolyl cis-trans isomerase [Pirellulaceae bacterium]